MSCWAWALRGECRANAGWMLPYCQTSCCPSRGLDAVSRSNPTKGRRIVQAALIRRRSRLRKKAARIARRRAAKAARLRFVLWPLSLCSFYFNESLFQQTCGCENPSNEKTQNLAELVIWQKIALLCSNVITCQVQCGVRGKGSSYDTKSQTFRKYQTAFGNKIIGECINCSVKTSQFGQFGSAKALLFFSNSPTKNVCHKINKF